MNRGRQIIAQLTAVDFAGIAGAGALAAVLIFGVLGPLAVRGREGATQSERAARLKQRTNGTTTAVRQLTEEIERTRARIAAAPLHLRAIDTLNQQLAGLVELSGQCGLMVDDVKPGVAVRGVRYVAVPIALTGRGGYRASAEFLHRLHERFPDVGVCAFRLSGGPAADGCCVFELQWIALPTQAAVAAAGQ